jgi:hypothetical protein
VRVFSRELWLDDLQEKAIEIHHAQRSRGTVPIYGQALALGNLMEQMHVEVGPNCMASIHYAPAVISSPVMSHS